jgi:hypothetical protein
MGLSDSDDEDLLEKWSKLNTNKTFDGGKHNRRFHNHSGNF